MQYNQQQLGMIRADQVKSLRTRIPRASQLTPDQNQWGIKLVNPDMTLLTQICISFPATFPLTPPDVRVSPVVVHRWIDQATGVVVGHPDLSRQWHANLDIGRIASEIVQEFTMRPPVALDRTPFDSVSSRNSADNPSGTSADNPSLCSVEHSTGPYLDIPNELPEITNLPVESLSVLDQSEEALHDFLGEMDVMQGKKVVLVELLENNAGIATKTLELEPIFRNIATQLGAKFKVIQERRDEVTILLAEQKTLMKKTDLPRLQEMLHAKIAQAMANCEDVQQGLVAQQERGEGKFSLKTYFDSRRIFHRLAAKSDKVRVALGPTEL